MPRELNDRLLMKTYYVVVEDISFNARAVNSLFRNPLVLPHTQHTPSTSYSDVRARMNRFYRSLLRSVSMLTRNIIRGGKKNHRVAQSRTLNYCALSS